MPLPAGTRLGPYEIVSPIGAGGMGEVYRARDSRLDRDVAVKVLPDAVAGDAAALARFEREAKSIAALSHPNILAIHDVGREGSVSFAVTELLEGETLAERLASSRFSWRKAVEIGTAIADGLSAAQSRGIVHRDMKPANVFVTSDGRVKILDFGLARVAPLPGTDSMSPTAAPETRPGTVMGTVGYMSPEQVRGRPVDARSDLFSLGCVLYEMLSGRRPFARETAAEAMTAILREEPPPISAEAQVPTELAQVVSRCLEKSPEERFQSASDLAFHLRAILASATDPRGARFPRTRPRAGLAWPWIAAALAVAAIALALSLSRREPSSGTRPAAATDRVESIAVLPLQNLSRDPDEDYFAEGMTEALITDLARIEALHVISRTSVMQYKGVKKPLPQIARELGVDAVVEGSVLKAGNRVRITAQLIEAATDRHLWARSYERPIADVLDLQSDVARAIASEIQVELSPEERASLSRPRPVDPVAYEEYLKGRASQFQFNEVSFRKALEHYQRAVSLDPGYALAWAGIAETYGQAADLFLPTVEAFSNARAAAEKALRHDESLAEAHTSLGMVKAFFDWDWKEGEEELRRAIELNPNSAWGHDWLGWYLTTQHRFEEAIPVLRRAAELDPLAAPIQADLALPYLLKGDHARAKQQIERALALNPGFFGARNFRMWLREAEGDLEGAIREAEKLRGLGVDSIAIAELGRVLGLAGRRREAERMLGELEELSRKQHVSPFFYAVIHAGLGDKDHAFEWLERCVRGRVVALSLFAKIGPLLDPLRSDPRFAALLRRMNLAS